MTRLRWCGWCLIPSQRHRRAPFLFHRLLRRGCIFTTCTDVLLLPWSSPTGLAFSYERATLTRPGCSETHPLQPHSLAQLLPTVPPEGPMLPLILAPSRREFISTSSFSSEGHRPPGNSTFPHPMSAPNTRTTMATNAPATRAPTALASGLFQCGTCRRKYKRLDHLARHVRSRKMVPNTSLQDKSRLW